MQMDRTRIIEDKNFWLDLEFRMSGDLQSSDADFMRRYWIDGFLPSEVKNSKQGVVVSGRVWMAEHGSGKQEQWAFEVEVPQNMLHKPIKNYEYNITNFDEVRMLLVLELAKQAAQQVDAPEPAKHADSASQCRLRRTGDR